MKYLIYCKKTHKLLAVYTNAKSLQTLDTDKCYYKEQAEVKAKPRQHNFSSDRSRSMAVNMQQNDAQSSTNDYFNPFNPIGFYAQQQSVASHNNDTSHSNNYGSSSDCGGSSGSSDSSSSSSSSCDSSSF